jgi:hypothetical protein
MRKILDRGTTITLSTRAAVAGSSRRTLYTGVLCLAMLNPSSAQASQSIDYLKLYAHSRIVSEIQYNCFNKLITKESNWRVDAVNPNGKHFGLGQMRNTKYRNLDGYRMIDWSLRGTSIIGILDQAAQPLSIGESMGGIDVKSLERWKHKPLA